jgi:HNH endonuclease
MNASLIRLVWERAQDRCEYCQIGQEFERNTYEIDHIVSRKHEGPSLARNLALSCVHCNVFKGSDIARGRKRGHSGGGKGEGEEKGTLRFIGCLSELHGLGKKNLGCPLFLSLLWGFLYGALAGFAFPPASVDRLALEVLPSVITATSMLAGLMAVAQSILLAQLDRPVIEYLKSEGYYEDLVNSQGATIRAQLLFIAACLLAMVLRVANVRHPAYLSVAPAALAFLGVLVWCCTWRQMNLVFKILTKKDGKL